MNVKLNHKGFTLVEVLVAVGVLSVTSLAFLPSFSKANKEKNLQQNSASVKDVLSTARNKALTEVGNPGTSDYRFSGVKFTDGSNTYVLFRSAQANSAVCNNPGTGGVVDATKLLSNDVVFRLTSDGESPTCIFFEYGTGRAYNTKGPDINAPTKLCSDQ